MTNIININQSKLSAHADRFTDDEITQEERKEIFETWGITADEFGDLTYWGHEFRKPVLLQHMSALRDKAAAQTYESPQEALGEQLALAVASLLISRMNVGELGKMVDKVIGTALSGKREERIAGHFEAIQSIHLRVAELHPL
jgi:hypothetical protein